MQLGAGFQFGNWKPHRERSQSSDPMKRLWSDRLSIVVSLAVLKFVPLLIVEWWNWKMARRAVSDTIGKLVIEAVIMLSARSQSDGGKVLRAAAQAYGIDTDAVPLKVKQDFAAKGKVEKSHQARGKTTGKAKMIRSESRSLWTCPR